MAEQHYTPQNIKGSSGWFSICNGCGALVGKADESKHNKFHEAIAKLWDMVSSLQK